MLTFSQKMKRYSFALPDCHNKLNQYGRQSLMDKEKSIREFYHLKGLNQSLSLPQTDRKRNEGTLSRLRISHDARSVQKRGNPELEKQFKKLTDIQLDSPRELNQIRYGGQIKIPTVHNDYHVKATNGGYSRSSTGGIFPK